MKKKIISCADIWNTCHSLGNKDGTGDYLLGEK